MSDEPIADVVARVLAYEEMTRGQGASALTDAVTLAREVARLTEELAKEQMERSDAELQLVSRRDDLRRGDAVNRETLAHWAEAQADLARLRDGIEELRRDYPNLDWYDVRDRVDALLAPTTETQP